MLSSPLSFCSRLPRSPGRVTRAPDHTTRIDQRIRRGVIPDRIPVTARTLEAVTKRSIAPEKRERTSCARIPVRRRGSDRDAVRDMSSITSNRSRAAEQTLHRTCSGRRQRWGKRRTSGRGSDADSTPKRARIPPSSQKSEMKSLLDQQLRSCGKEFKRGI